MDGSKVMDDSKYNRTDAHMIQRLWQHTHGLCRERFESDGVPALRGRSGHGLLPLTKKLSATDSHQQWEKLVFANGGSLGILTTLQCRSWCSEVVGQHKTDLMVFL